MERNNIISKEAERMLLEYSRLLFEQSQHVNITGLKSEEDIYQCLILDSLAPFLCSGVPRGTLFADLGTGAGIPGIPLAIVFPEVQGVLMDSNNKKVEFINKVIDKLQLSNISAIHGRGEEMAHNPVHRGVYSVVFTRALGNPYLVCELGAGLLQEKGVLFHYSSIKDQDLPEEFLDHINTLGLNLVARDDTDLWCSNLEGLVFVKKGVTSDRYPRRFAVIKREGRRLFPSY